MRGLADRQLQNGNFVAQNLKRLKNHRKSANFHVSFPGLGGLGGASRRPPGIRIIRPAPQNQLAM